MTTGISVSHATLFDNQLILLDDSSWKYFTIDHTNKSLDGYNLPSRLFSNLSVREVHFENGSQGSFHSDNAIRTYVKKGDKFVVDIKASTSNYLSRAASEIEASRIEQLINVVDQSRFLQVSLKDLNIFYLILLSERI